MKSVITKLQKKTFRKTFVENGRKRLIVAEVRYDDERGNGHNTFTITGTTYRGVTEREAHIESCGCNHAEIAEHFPELAHLIKWHLTTSEGPWGYVSNTVYYAGDRDYNGLRKGEPNTFYDKTQVFFDSVPVPHVLEDGLVRFLMDLSSFDNLEIEEHAHGKDPKTYGTRYTFKGYLGQLGGWYGCPFTSKQEAQQYLAALQNCGVTFKTVHTAWGEGKERDLDAARRTAIWPDATDEELCAPKEELTKALRARLPELMERFKADIDALGSKF